MTACRDNLFYLECTDEVSEFSFLKVNNPTLEEDVFLKIEHDVISGRVPYGTNIKSLIPTFSAGDKISINDKTIISGISSCDFSKVVECQIEKDDIINFFSIDVKYFTGLPILNINTDNNDSILSKTEYVYGLASFEGYDKYDDFEGAISIRGRGNSTFSDEMPKKSYQIKFDEQVDVMGFGADKKWVLLANYADKTMIRTMIAFELGYMSDLNWTPKCDFVEVFINNHHQGTYLMSQKVEVSSDRVDIDRVNGYLLELEIPSRFTDEDVYFTTYDDPRSEDISLYSFDVKAPEIVNGDEQYKFIEWYMNTFVQVLFSDNYLDPVSGYAAYIDIESFVDWYVINEICKGVDSKFKASVYFTLEEGGKLKIGPLWDYDLSMGNSLLDDTYSSRGTFIADAPWFRRLLESPEFVTAVSERFEYYINQEENIYSKIRETADYLDYSQEENNKIWDLIGNRTWPNYWALPSYEDEIAYLEIWLKGRMECVLNDFNETVEANTAYLSNLEASEEGE